MTWLTHTRFPVCSLLAAALTWLLPSSARAAWGSENWGEMVWGGPPPVVPAIPVEGQIALAVLFVLVAATLLTRRRHVGRS